MTGTDPYDWQRIIDLCWPAERMLPVGPWTLRITPGAGGRVNSISGDAPDDLSLAEDTARAQDQRPSFIIHQGQDTLDDALDARGYVIEDAVNIWAMDIGPLTQMPLPHATAFTIWPPLQIMRDIWAEGGHVTPVRQAVMARAAQPGGILARVDDRAAGVGFVAAGDDTAMLSAIHVLDRHRRKGVAGNILRAAAHWARDRGCTRIALVAERANLPATATYAGHGMEIVAGYHYRRAPELS